MCQVTYWFKPIIECDVIFMCLIVDQTNSTNLFTFCHIDDSFMYSFLRAYIWIVTWTSGPEAFNLLSVFAIHGHRRFVEYSAKLSINDKIYWLSLYAQRKCVWLNHYQLLQMVEFIIDSIIPNGRTLLGIVCVSNLYSCQWTIFFSKVECVRTSNVNRKFNV